LASTSIVDASSFLYDLMPPSEIAAWALAAA